MNRRQRRAQATAASTSIESAEDIPLSQPERSSTTTKKKTRTLYEIAAEKQAELLPGVRAFDGVAPSGAGVINIKIGHNGEIIEEEEETETTVQIEQVPPLIDTLFLASSLSAIHFTLETLTVHQYAQELRFPPIFKHTFFVAFPTLALLVHLFHGHVFSMPASAFSQRTRSILYIAQQLLYVIIANYAGCYLIQLTNDKGYYAVMKNAPSVGTIWVWAIIELGLAGALVGVTGPGIYAWWHGYGIF